MVEFSARRRQRFISEEYYEHWVQFHLESVELWSTQLPANGSEDEKRAQAAADRAQAKQSLLLLHFTAGEPIEKIRDELEGVIAEYEEFSRCQAKVHRPGWPPLRMSAIEDYETVVQLLGLCHLLHRRDLLPRLAALEDPTYAGTDSLYEDLLAYAIQGRFEVDGCIHDSYIDCLNSIYGESDEERLTDLNAYLEQWYSMFSEAGWHDSHLDTSDQSGLYVGYWAIEAAALAYLLELDDTTLREHIVYPGDLVDFARTFEDETAITPASSGRTTVPTGQVCPETGIWKAQGHNVPGVLIQQGDRMPDVFAPDKSGAHRPQPALWEYERKA